MRALLSRSLIYSRSIPVFIFLPDTTVNLLSAEYSRALCASRDFLVRLLAALLSVAVKRTVIVTANYRSAVDLIIANDSFRELFKTSRLIIARCYEDAASISLSFDVKQKEFVGRLGFHFLIYYLFHFGPYNRIDPILPASVSLSS